jgi:2-methylcitrate dehydratase PrpD
MPSALSRIAEHVARGDLRASEQSLGFLRDALIDIYGCMLAGAREPVAQKACQALCQAGLAGDHGAAPIFGSALRAAPGHAAMANAVAGHALEFDDWEISGNTHVSVLLVPAILAVSSGRRLSGRDAIAAYLAGYETIARIGEAINLEHYLRGWHATATIGAVGVAAAVSRLLGLDGETTANALAIATSRGLGYNAQFGSEAKPLQVGFAVEGGILAARMAAAGLTGQAHMLEHKAGMAALMAPGSTDRVEASMARLGRSAAIDEYRIVFKPWPSCGYTHRIMTGMLTLRTRGLEPAAIEEIELRLPSMHAGILPFRHPSCRGEALFSLPYCAAMALCEGDLTLANLARESWLRDDIRRLIDLTRVEGFEPQCPDLNFDPAEPDRIRVRAAGETLEVAIPYPLGAPQKPMLAEHHRQKFRCTCGLDEAAADRLYARLQDWPEAENLHHLFIPNPAADETRDGSAAPG